MSKLDYETVRLVKLHDWDELVQETYGRPYKFQQQDGCKDRGTFALTVPDRLRDYENDSVPEVVNGSEMGVSLKGWLARDPKQPFADGATSEFGLGLWWHRNFYPHIQAVANDLHAKGLLEAGDYLINIDW
jgi:hypothetical protein